MDRRRPTLLLLALALLALSVEGCLFSRGSNPPARYWMLDSLPGPPSETAMDSLRILGVGPVSIPPHLDRPELVTRTGANELHVHARDFWAEPLRVSVKRVLAEDLTVLVPDLRTVLFPWKGPGRPDYQLAVEISRLDARPGGPVELLANYVLTSEDGETLLVDTAWIRQAFEEDETAVIVAAVSKAVEVLSRKIAGQLTPILASGRASE